jgi:uncharacterized membrane protein YjjP (DUF1212 family)
MTITTILLLLLSLIVASGLSYYQYFCQKQIKAEFVFGFVAFSIVVWIILLLINPIITRNTLEIIKPSLAIVVDNSSSITALDASKKKLYGIWLTTPH